MQNNAGQTQKFSVKKRAKSFAHAGRGVWIFIKTSHNAWIQLSIFVLVVLLGLYFRITPTDWALLVLASGFVLAAEAFNSAIEIHLDLTSPTYHPYARDTKDVAAGAVLISAITAVFVGLFIFGPQVLRLLGA